MTQEREVVRLSVNLPKDAVEALRAIATREGTTLTEALRRSISTQQFVESTLDSGGKILIEDPSEKSLKQVVFR